MFVQSLLLCACVVLPVDEQETREKDCVALVETLISLNGSHGENHPEVIAIRRKIARLQELGVEPDLNHAEERLQSLVIERQELLESLGARHPRVIQNAIRISAIAKLLAGGIDRVLKERPGPN